MIVMCTEEKYVLTTMPLCVAAKVTIWKGDTKANYTKCNDHFKSRDFQNQVDASIQDLNTLLGIR